MIRFTEAIQLKDGILCHLEYHQKRLNRTMSHFYGKTVNLSQLNNQIPLSARKGLFKCRVVYTDKIEQVEFIPYIIRQVDKVGLVIDDTIDYSHKYADRTWLNELLIQSGCDDIIILKNDLVTDGFSSNLVFESPEGLFTPDSFLLPGTKRQYLLDRKIICERRITLENIREYSRVYFVNAMVDLEDGLGVEINSICASQ